MLVVVAAMMMTVQCIHDPTHSVRSILFHCVIKFFFPAAPTRWSKREIFLRPPCHCPGEKKDIAIILCTSAPIIFPPPPPSPPTSWSSSQKTPSVRVSSSSARDQQGVRVESRSSTLGRQTHRSAKQSKLSKRLKRFKRLDLL